MMVPLVLSVSGGIGTPSFDDSSAHFILCSETTASSGGGEAVIPNLPAPFPLRPDYYRLLQGYYSRTSRGRLLRDLEFVTLDRPASVSDASRDETLAQISEISGFVDGWDGYGAFSPSKFVCECARSLVSVLALDFPDLPSPEVAPTPNGTLTFFWEAPGGKACIEVGDKRFSAYVRYKDYFIPIEGDCSNLGPEELQLISTCLYQ